MEKVAQLCIWGLFLAVAGQAGAIAGEALPANSLTIRADWFDRGNVRISRLGEQYADKYACIWNAGKQPNQAEYDIDLPVTAKYTFSGLYTAHNSRPVDIYLDGKRISRGFSNATGSWQTKNALWETQCTIPITKGRHTIKLLCPGACMPHICAFRLATTEPFPSKWRLNRSAARRARQASGPATKVAGGAHLVPELPILLDAQMQATVTTAEQLVASTNDTNDELLIDETAWVDVRTPWVALVKGGDGHPSPLALDPDRLREMLTRTLEWIADFRSMPGTRSDYLEQQRAAVQVLSRDLQRLLGESDRPSKWQSFVTLLA